VLPRHREEAVAMLQRVLDYNGAAAPEERFDGINLDIEPHILAEWSTRKMELLAGFVEMSDALMRAEGGVGPGPAHGAGDPVLAGRHPARVEGEDASRSASMCRTSTTTWR
jgi:hypothetical protein